MCVRGLNHASTLLCKIFAHAQLRSAVSLSSMNSASALQLAVHNWKVLPHAETKAAFAKAALEFLQDLFLLVIPCLGSTHFCPGFTAAQDRKKAGDFL